jgi:hypothetical protein
VRALFSSDIRHSFARFEPLRLWARHGTARCIGLAARAVRRGADPKRAPLALLWLGVLYLVVVLLAG